MMVVFFTPEKTRKIFFCGGEGKGGKYLEQENIFWTRRLKTEKEKEGKVWRLEIFFLWKTMKGRKIFGEKHLENNNILCRGEAK